MNIPRFVLAGSLLAALLTSFVPLRLSAAAPKEEVLVDFTDVRTDHDTGKVLKNYEYSWESWNKHIADLPRRGCLVQAPSGKGGLGENKTSVEFNKYSTVFLTFVVGNANNTKSINFALEDSDETEQSWSISLEPLTKGREYRIPLDLTKCTTETKPGKKPGLNLKKISTWQIRGDYSDANVEVLLIKLVAPKS